MKNFLSLTVFAALFLGLGALVLLAAPRDSMNLIPGSAPNTLNEVEAAENTTGFTWVAIPLNVFSSGSMASDLAAHVEANNNNNSITVKSVSEWNPSGQSLTTYSHEFGFGDFSISNQRPYRVETTGGESVVWTQVGDVPDIGSYSFELLETASTDFNWIMYPLDRNDGLASDIANDIEANASGEVIILSVSEWNASGQTLTTYSHEFGFGDFAIRPGYPYRVEVDVVNGSSVIWP